MKKKYIVISLLSILVMTIGMSYAYFTGMVIGEGKPINVKANRLAIIFTDTEEIANVEIEPGWSTSKTFTVENKSGSVFYYDINIEDLINTFVTTGYLQYKITSTDGGYNMEEFIDIPKSEEARKEVLKSGIQIDNEEKHTYTVEFRYFNSEEDQSEDMGKVFDGRLSITESEIMVIKYKVNDTEERYFHVISDDGDTLTLQQRDNTLDTAMWYDSRASKKSDTSKGPLTALSLLENATSTVRGLMY